MKKKLWVLIFALLPMLLPAFDSDWLGSVYFENRTKGDIEYIFFSPGDSDYWGPELLGSEEILERGEEIGFYAYFPNSCDDFDVLAINDDGEAFFLYDLEICDDEPTYVELSSKDFSDDPPDFDYVTLTLYNDLDLDIYYLFVSPGDSEMYGMDYMDEETVLEPGEEISILVPLNESNEYDILAIDEENDGYTFSLTVEEDTYIPVEYSDYNPDM